LIVDNGNRHSAVLAAGSIHLSRGVHTIFVRYFQDGGLFHLELLWGREGSALEPVPLWALRPPRVNSLARVIPSLLLEFSLEAMEWIWVGVLLFAAAAAVRFRLAGLRRFLEPRCAWPALRWILAASLILNIVGIWWGLPGRWAPLELTPDAVLDGLSQRFSNGWSDAYPPFHFYALTVAMSPMLLLRALGRIDFDTAFGYTALVLLTRFVSIAASAGALAATCLAGTRAFGKRAGLFATGIVALTAPFVYYSKTANVDVPFLFWWALSLVFYLRLLDNPSVRDGVLFGASATLAICTKDQAFALYLLVPPLLVHQLWRANRRAGVSRPLGRALFDRRLAAIAVTAIVVFTVCHNLLFNLKGFLAHVDFLVGGSAVGSYRVFEPTIAGRLALLRLTAHLIQESFGWPLLLVSLTGLFVAVAAPRLRSLTVWLLLPVVSYYLGFINVILFNYDRFVLPMCLVLALFGGLALDAFLTWSAPGKTWRGAGVAAIFAYTLLYAGTVDVLMLGDSRYVVQQWMKTHVQRDELVGMAGPREILPTLDSFYRVDIGSVAELERDRPGYYVLNADYGRAVSLERPWGQLIAGLQQHRLGYQLAFRFRREAPWRWLPGAHPDLVGARQETLVFSTLRDINPTIEIFQRESIDGPVK
jgi:hypothetical protein